MQVATCLSMACHSLRVARQVLGDRDASGCRVSDRQEHVTRGGQVVDVPPVAVAEGDRIAGYRGRVVVARGDVVARVVVAEEGAVVIAGETVGGEHATGRH